MTRGKSIPESDGGGQEQQQQRPPPTNHSGLSIGSRSSRESTDKNDNRNSSIKTKKNGDAKLGQEMASITDTFRFVFGCGARVSLLFGFGIFAAVLNGLVMPALAWLFSSAFSDVAGAAANGLEQIEQLALYFVYLGVYSLAVGTAQGFCFEVVAYKSSLNFRLQVCANERAGLIWATDTIRYSTILA